MKINGKRKQKLILFGIVMLLMLVCAGFTSPLYPHYTGLDSSVFLTIAKGITVGKVPYRDLFDHKGPVFYWMESIGYLFGGRTGVFLFQCLLLGLDLALIDRISALFYADFPAAAIPFVAVFFTLFQHGNLTEEFSTPFVLWAVYYELRFLKSKENQHAPRIGYLYGIILGLLAFIRLNNAVVVCALLLCIIIVLAANRQWGNILINIGLGILGLATVIIPVCLYYYRQGALYDMIYGTFLRNLIYAKDNTHYPILKAPFHYCCLFLPGICAFAVFFKKWREERSRVYVSLLFTTVLTYGMLAYSNIYAHYFLLGIPVFTVAAAAIDRDHGFTKLCLYLNETFFHKRREREKNIEEKKHCCHLTEGCAIFLLIVTVLYTGNSAYSASAPVYKTYLTDIAYDEYSQVQAGISVIPEEERNSVIAYNVLANYYYHADILPCFRYFTLQRWLSTDKVNLGQEFMDYVKTEHPLWVIINANEKEKAILEILSENYAVVYYDDLYIICRYNRPEN